MSEQEIQDECRRVWNAFCDIVRVHKDPPRLFPFMVVDPMVQHLKEARQAIVNTTVSRLAKGQDKTQVIENLNHLRHDVWTHREFHQPLRLFISLMILHVKKGDLLSFLDERNISYPKKIEVPIARTF